MEGLASLKTAAISAAMAALVVFVVDHREAGAARPPTEVRIRLDGLPTSTDPRSYPQFDSGDTRSVVDPDGGPDRQTGSHSCRPDGGDCDDGPHDPAERVYRA